MKLRHSFILLLLAMVVAVPASEASTSHQWSLSKGANLAEISATGLHLDQSDPTDTTSYATATAKLHFAAAPMWRVAFSIRFGHLRSAGAAVRLYSGPTVIAWVGADGWYKGIGAFIGNTNKFGQPADMRWHQVVCASDGRALTIWLDSVQVATEASTITPDAITIGSWWDGKSPPGQQTEVWIRNVQEQAVTNPMATPPVITPSIVPSYSTPTQDFRGVPLDRLVQDYNDNLTRAQEANRAVRNSCNNTNGYLDLMAKAYTDEDLATDKKEADYCMEQEKRDMADQKRYLRLALAMHQAIQNAPSFSRFYHETHQCLPPEEVTLDMREARELRFIEKR